MRIAIIGCKRQKQNYACSADEMYSKAPTFVAQQKWIKQVYDDYYIFSSKYGIIHHTTVIEPYDITLEDTVLKYQIARTSTESNIPFLQLNIKEFMSNNVYNTLHFHVTRGYWDYIKFYNNAVHIKQQKNTGLVYKRYTEALGYGLEEGLKIIQTPVASNPESSHIWEHTEWGTFEGTSFQLWKAYKDKINKFDQAVLRKVGFSIYGHHKGWRLKCK